MLVITLGDPWSITQDCLMRLSSRWFPREGQTVVLVGSLTQWHVQAQERAWPLPEWNLITRWEEIVKPGLYFFSIDQGEPAIAASALSEVARGAIAVRSLASLRTLPRNFASRMAVLTAPIDKKVCQLAGFPFPGQTEFFIDLWQEEGVMLLAGPRLRVALATNHLALRDVSASLTSEIIVRKAQLLSKSLQEIFRIPTPRLAIAALNPHAGDRGLFGEEDQTIVEPAVRQLREQGYVVTGPLPADTVFFRAYEGAFDAVLAMYHDQGLAPLKTVHFYDAVNITGGMSSLRISPDHGPASELFGQSAACEDSFRMALETAMKYLSKG